MLKWADIVDGALYESPQAAVEMAEPAMKLTLVIESTDDPTLIPRLIPLLTSMPLAEILEQPFVAALAAAASQASPGIARAHPRSRGMCRRNHLLRHLRSPHGGLQQVHPLLPVSAGRYSIGLSKSSFRTKVAVGSNPWTKVDPATMVNLAPSASATAAADTRVSAPSASRRTSQIWRARLPQSL